jgi:hypothetical protein
MVLSVDGAHPDNLPAILTLTAACNSHPALAGMNEFKSRIPSCGIHTKA